MSSLKNSYNPETGIYSYKKDGQWFFSICPPDQVASKRVDGKWYWIEKCIGGGGDGPSVPGKDGKDGEDGKGWTEGSYDEATGVVTFSSEDGLGFSTEDLRGAPGKDGADGKDGTEVNLSAYATQEWVLDQSYITEQPVTDGDAATLKSANEYTDAQIDAIEFPEGVDLSKYAETTYVDGADQAVQRFATTADEAVLSSAKKYTDDSLGAIPEVSEPDVDKAYVDEQDGKRMPNSGNASVVQDWRIRSPHGESGNLTYVKIANDKLHLYHVADPTSDEHGISRGYADGRYSKIQEPITFKCDQYAAAVSNANTPPSGSFCGLNNSSPGSSTNANLYFGNFNADIRIHIDKLLNPEGEQFAKSERYIIRGTVSIFGKNNNKLYFRHSITSVSRDNNDYVTIHFCSRVPSWGTGAVTDEDKYAVIVEGVIDKQVVTVDIPDEE